MIRCQFDCDECGIKDAAFEVRERGKVEDILEWMKMVTLAVSVTHRKLSPLCDAQKLTALKIPLPSGHSRVGDPTKN